MNDPHGQENLPILHLLSVDEKTSIQALKRKYPHKPTMPGRMELIEHEYKRHGTCCLTAGFEVATGGVMGMLTPNRPAEVFAEFMEWVCQYYCDARAIHIVLDNLNTHYHELTCQVVADFCKCDPGQIKTGRQRKDFLTDPSKRVVLLQVFLSIHSIVCFSDSFSCRQIEARTMRQWLSLASKAYI